jgi:hypothetical protein
MKYKAYIPVLLGSSRTLRQSVKVAQFILEQLSQCDRKAGRSTRPSRPDRTH